MLLKSPLTALLVLAFSCHTLAATPTPDELDSLFAARGIVYQQDDNGGNINTDENATIYEGILLFQKRLNDTNAASVKAVGDIVSAASYDDARDKAETVSAATGYNPGRFNIETRWKYRSSDVNSNRFGVNIHASYGQEFAYRSTGYGFGLSQSLNEESTQLSAQFQYFDDTVRMIRYDGSKETDAPRDTFTSTLSLTQTLSPISLFDVSWVHSKQTGMLATSFNSVIINQPPNSSQRDIEKAPDVRVRDTLSFRYKHALGKDSVQLGASTYRDDWNLHGHAVEARYFYRLYSGRLTLEPSYRFYTQDEADFFATQFDAIQTFQTSDSDLGNFDGHSAGLLVSYWTSTWLTSQLSNYEIGFNYYQRSDNLDFYWLTLGWYTPL
jgi:hypothetical protein